MRVFYDLNKHAAACAAAQITAEINTSTIAYLRQCLIDAGFSVAVWPSRNFMSRNLTVIIAETAHQKIISEVRVELLSPMKILAAHISNAKLPKNIQKGLTKIANIPLCLSIGPASPMGFAEARWLVGADIIRLLKKSFNPIYLGGGPTTPIRLWD
jgi:hypothetical protein